MRNWIAKAREFISEVYAEIRKATFPSREELVGTTVVVLITSVAFAVYLWIADRGISWVVFKVINQ